MEHLSAEFGTTTMTDIPSGKENEEIAQYLQDIENGDDDLLLEK